MLRSAVERQLGIVGEVLAQLAKKDPATSAEVPELARIVAFRNVLVHGYGAIDDKLVWGIVARNLPPLRTALARLLQGG
jgi:uncharacterized protein with HEPN domain